MKKINGMLEKSYTYKEFSNNISFFILEFHQNFILK